MGDDRELHEAVYDNYAVAHNASVHLEYLAGRLDELGMAPRISEGLHSIAANIEASASRVRRAYGTHLNATCRHNETMAGNMVLLALKMATEKEA